MLYLNYLFLIFEWSACKLAGQAKCSFHYKQAFNLLKPFNKRLKGVRFVTGGFLGLQGGYSESKGLQEVTRAYRGLQGVT